MTTDGTLPLQPRQFRLRSLFLVVTICACGFAVLRQLVVAFGITWLAVLIAAVVLTFITTAVYFAARLSSGGGTIAGGMWGTIGGGAAFGVLLMLPIPDDTLLTAMTFAPILGAIWAAVFLVVGFIATRITIELYGRHSLWNGAACGAATGCASLVWLNDSAMFVFSTLVGALYGGFGGAVQRYYNQPPAKSRITRPARVDLRSFAPPADSAN